MDGAKTKRDQQLMEASYNDVVRELRSQADAMERRAKIAVESKLTPGAGEYMVELHDNSKKVILKALRGLRSDIKEAYGTDW